MTRPNFTDISIVLDRSGSMQSCHSGTVEAFNTFLDGQQKVPGDAVISLYEFDHEYLPLYVAAPLQFAAKLTLETFVPRGSTALNGAIGKTIEDTGKRLAAMPESARPSKVLIVILTDGEENYSECVDWAKPYATNAKIQEMINHQRDKYSWQFVYLGANQDAIREGLSKGFKAGSSANFRATNQGTKTMSMGLCASTTTYRGMSQGCTDNFFDTSDLSAGDDKTAVAPTTPTLAVVPTGKVNLTAAVDPLTQMFNAQKLTGVTEKK